MSTEPENKDYGQRMNRGLAWFARAMLRLIAILLAFGLVGLALYAGARYIYPRYLAPIDANTAQVHDLQDRQAQDRQHFEDEVSRLQERIAALETQHTRDRETISGLVARLDEAEKAMAAADARLAELDRLQSDLAKLQADLEITAGTYGAQIDGRLASPDGPLAVIRRQVQMLRVMELLSRSQLALAQNNAGQARQDLEVLRVLFVQLEDEALAEQKPAVERMLIRLDLALANLPGFPVLASRDLDILWELLLVGLPGDPGSLEGMLSRPSLLDLGLSDTPTPVLEWTPTLPPQVIRSTTATAVPNLSPTPTGTPTPFATPTP